MMPQWQSADVGRGPIQVKLKCRRHCVQTGTSRRCLACGACHPSIPADRDGAKPNFRRMIVLPSLSVVMGFLLLVLLSCMDAWARDPDETVFKIRKALNVELFLHLSGPQSNGQPASSPYDLNPRNYRLKEPPDIKAAGFDAVRLAVEPVPLLNMTEPERRAIYPTFAKFIDRYLAAGLNVVFDIHVTGRDPVWNLDTLATHRSDQKFKSYADVVVSVARFLAAYDPRRVALELFNEPPCISASRWSELQKTLYVAARNVIPDHTLVVTGPCWSSIDEFLKIDARGYDQNTIYTFHFYQPTLFTFQGIPWLKGGFKFVRRLPYPPSGDRSGEFIAAMEADVRAASELDDGDKAKIASYMGSEIRRYFGTPMNRDWLKGRLSAAQLWARRMRISPRRILVGEFGASRDIDGYLGAASEDRMQWLEDVRTLFEMAGFSWAVWSDCCAFGILVDAADSFDPAALKALGLKGIDRSVLEPAGK